MTARDQIDLAYLKGAIDSALVLWHRWADGKLPVEGYPSECPSCRMSKAARRADTQYEDAERNEWTDRAEAIDAIIDGMGEPYKTALAINARNLATGAHVWVSVRLPLDKAKALAVTAMARDRFAVLMGEML